MIEIHRSGERGQADHGWLHARHSFSFADYYNPARMNFGALRVLNEDIVEPAQGFGTHAHDNMEIVTIVLEGELEHRDSQGNHGIIRPGDVQRMSAGYGIQHSEFNHSKKDKVHLLQIWVRPRENGIPPGYEQKTFPESLKRGRFLTVVSGEKNQECLYLHQNAVFSLGSFQAGESASYKLRYPKNGVYVFMMGGQMTLEGQRPLFSGDAAAVTQLPEISFSFQNRTDLLLIEVPLVSA